METKTSRWIVSGRVQGVFFRAWTREQADELGLRGWVRNRPDGTVEVLAHGDAETLSQLERKLHEGPPAAKVTGVDRQEADEPPPGDGFRVSH
jgi:acylphosphatase